MKKCIALLLACCLLLGGCGVASGTADDRRTVSFQDMSYTRPNLEAITAEFESLSAQIAQLQSGEALVTIFDESEALTEDFQTQYTVAYLHHYLDTTDAYYEEEYRLLSDMEVDVYRAQTELWELLLQSPYIDALRAEVGDYYFSEIERSVLFNNDKVNEYQRQRNQLNIDYNLVRSQMLEDGDTNYAAQAEYFTDLYCQMIALDNLMAAELGYDTAAEMYYASYSRDYTPEDSMKIASYVKSYFSPYIYNVYSNYYVGGTEAELSTVTSAVPKLLKSVSSDMVDTWNAMMRYDLYDFEMRSGKQSGMGFCTSISGYDAAFIYSNWEGDFDSALTIVHEFGHFYNFYYHSGEQQVFNLDLAETQSQGLEYMLHSQYGTLASDPSGINDAAALQSAYDTFLYQSLLEEYTLLLYQMEDFTADEAATVYNDLLVDYGYYINYGAQDYSWYMVPHLFDSPFYTISYVTSLAAALQLWTLADEDWDAAVDTYLAITEGDQNRPFTEVITSAGLRATNEEQLYIQLSQLCIDIIAG